MSESRYTAQLEDEINKGIRYLYPYYRVVFNLLRTLSEEKKRNPFCHDMVHQDIKFFRAQLSEGELIWISLNLLYHSEGANLSKYVDEFGLLKHLQSQAVKDDLLEKYLAHGIKYTISTDVAKDGLLQGPSMELYKKMQDKFPDLHIIASGGVSNIGDIEALHEAGVPAVIFGKALYEGHITLKDLRRFID